LTTLLSETFRLQQQELKTNVIAPSPLHTVSEAPQAILRSKPQKQLDLVYQKIKKGSLIANASGAEP